MLLFHLPQFLQLPLPILISHPASVPPIEPSSPVLGLAIGESRVASQPCQRKSKQKRTLRKIEHRRRDGRSAISTEFNAATFTSSDLSTVPIDQLPNSYAIARPTGTAFGGVLPETRNQKLENRNNDETVLQQ
jgi:hypothetical protein